jgi:ribosomal-protein-alanine N-acetyltransferase
LIRALEAADAQQIFAIISDLQAHDPGGFTGRHWTAEDVIEECRNRGWVDLSPTGDIDSFILMRDVGDAEEVTFLATRLGLQRSGRMRHLLIHGLKNVASVGNGELKKEVWLEVHEQNSAALRLYESIGFREVGRRLRYYSNGGTAILYSYR